MNLLDVINSPWAITAEKLAEISNVYVAHLRGEKGIDLKALGATAGRPFANKHEGYLNIGGVAVIPVQGVIAKRMNLFMQICGGTSTQLFQGDIAQALNDPSVHSILLDVDSPGGTVDGTQAAADAVRAVRGVKPVYALIDGMGASAAYWIASAADKVFIASDTTIVGSIGVVFSHIDYSKQNEQRGIKVSEITAGRYKRIASLNAPLTEEGRADLQGQADHIYSVFVDDVAANRGTDPRTVLTRMADGRVFLGKNSIEVGLADGISTLSTLIAELSQKRSAAVSTTGRAASNPMLASAATAEGGDSIYKQKFAEYTAQGMTKGEAMERAVADYQLTESLAAIKKVHEQQKTTTTTGEPSMSTQPSTPTNSADPIAVAQELAAKAATYRHEQRAIGRNVSLVQAIGYVAEQMGIDRSNPDNPRKEAFAIADRARAYQAEQAKLGITVSNIEAVMHVSETESK